MEELGRAGLLFFSPGETPFRLEKNHGILPSMAAPADAGPAGDYVTVAQLAYLVESSDPERRSWSKQLTWYWVAQLERETGRAWILPLPLGQLRLIAVSDVPELRIRLLELRGRPHWRRRLRFQQPETQHSAALNATLEPKPAE